MNIPIEQFQPKINLMLLAHFQAVSTGSCMSKIYLRKTELYLNTVVVRIQAMHIFK